MAAMASDFVEKLEILLQNMLDGMKLNLVQIELWGPLPKLCPLTHRNKDGKYPF
jgi:hypothetical protein